MLYVIYSGVEVMYDHDIQIAIKQNIKRPFVYTLSCITLSFIHQSSPDIHCLETSVLQVCV